MGAPFSKPSISNYNTNAPTDDGAETSANQVTWAKHKTKLADPIKTLAEAIADETETAFGKVVGGAGVTTASSDYTVLAADQGKLIKVTASATITTPDATSVGSPFVFSLLNLHSASITLDGNGSQTVNGSASLQVGPGDGYVIYTDGSNWFVLGRKTGVLGRGYIDGCTISNGSDATNDINIAAGVCRDSTNAVDITVAAMTGKQLDANWAAGGSAGMRNSAAGITDTTYHIYAVAKADGTQDIYAHTSTTVSTVLTALQAETGGSGYVYARRIGSILRESAAIAAFTQYGDHFLRSTAVQDVNSSNPGTSAVTRTLSVPLGISVLADVLLNVSEGDGSEVYALLTALSAADVAAEATNSQISRAINAAGGSTVAAAAVSVWTNTSGQIRSRLSASSANKTLSIRTVGWTDSRGRDI